MSIFRTSLFRLGLTLLAVLSTTIPLVSAETLQWRLGIGYETSENNNQFGEALEAYMSAPVPQRKQLPAECHYGQGLTKIHARKVNSSSSLHNSLSENTSQKVKIVCADHEIETEVFIEVRSNNSEWRILMLPTDDMCNKILRQTLLNGYSDQRYRVQKSPTSEGTYVFSRNTKNGERFYFGVGALDGEVLFIVPINTSDEKFRYYGAEIRQSLNRSISGTLFSYYRFVEGAKINKLILFSTGDIDHNSCIYDSYTVFLAGSISRSAAASADNAWLKDIVSGMGE